MMEVSQWKAEPAPTAEQKWSGSLGRVHEAVGNVPNAVSR